MSAITVSEEGSCILRKSCLHWMCSISARCSLNVSLSSLCQQHVSVFHISFLLFLLYDAADEFKPLNDAISWKFLKFWVCCITAVSCNQISFFLVSQLASLRLGSENWNQIKYEPFGISYLHPTVVAAIIIVTVSQALSSVIKSFSWLSPSVLFFYPGVR